jgi:hypothetical protein
MVDWLVKFLNLKYKNYNKYSEIYSNITIIDIIIILLRGTFSKNHIFWEIGKKIFSIFKFFF